MAPKSRRQSVLHRSSILARDFDLSEIEQELDEFVGDSNEKEEDRQEKEDDDDKHAKYERQQELDSSFHKVKRALGSFSVKAAVSLKSSRVDAFLCAFGLAGSLALLQYLTITTGYEFFGSFLIGSAMKFFYNENPGSLKAFFEATVFAIGVGLSLHEIPYYCGQYAQPVLLFVTILYWKLYGGMWGAANILAMIVAVESNGWSTVVPGMRDLNGWANSHEDDNTPKAHFPWHFLFFPYLSGHLILYVMACGMSLIRRKVRTALISREFLSKQCGFDWQTELVGGAERRERLRKLFNRMNTSGDGQLDVIELQVALRAATGTDISLADTIEILQSVDSDGNGSLDFDEFRAAIDKLWPE